MMGRQRKGTDRKSSLREGGVRGGGDLPPLMVNARNADIQLGAPGYFDASEHVRLMEVSRTVDRTRGDVHPGGNPHFLFDPRAASMVSEGWAMSMT